MPFPNGTLLPKKKADAKSSDPRAARLDADDSWFCRVCFAERVPPKAVRGYGPFNPLLQQLERENPSIFSLPVELRNYYKGVSTSADGSYVDSTSLRPLKLSRHGFVEERDPYLLRDKHGEAVLCYQCGGSALPPNEILPDANRTATLAEERKALDTLADAALAEHRPPRAPQHGRRMISCDFCNLHWHLDCAKLPMSGMPPPTRRWKCPAHSSHAEPRVRIPRAANQVKTVDVPLATEASVGGRRRAYGEVDVLPDADDKTFVGESGSGHSAAPPYEDVTVSNANGARVRYRIPEKTIRLEFWSRAALERKTPRPMHAPAPSATHRPLEDTGPIPASAWEQLLAVALRETRPSTSGTEARTPENVAQHAAAARASLAPNATPFDGAERSTFKSSEAVPLVPSARPDDVPQQPAAPSLTYVYPTELAELRAVKRLMKAKGADRLRDFLQQP